MVDTVSDVESTPRGGGDPLPSERWPHRPLLLRFHPDVSAEVRGRDCLPFHEQIPFRTPLFEGVAMVRCRGCPNANPHTEYFDGRRRQAQLVVQGRFTKKLRFDEVLTGQAFQHPIKLPYGTGLLMAIAKRLSPGLRADITAEKPYLLNLVACTAQSIHITPEGDSPPDLAAHEIPERCIPGMSATQRKRYLSDPRTASAFTFDPSCVYTFDFYQHMLHLQDWALRSGVLSVDISRLTNSQPIQFMACTDEGSLWNFECLHEKLFS
eukprot:Sspe_Gene.12254::Locus_4167_Transcript_1_1_Confidence_1.000_Length_1219::g.12254::m.12254